jgi:hypothetical protein
MLLAQGKALPYFGGPKVFFRITISFFLLLLLSGKIFKIPGSSLLLFGAASWINPYRKIAMSI